MNIEEYGEFLEKSRVVDLSKKVTPGKADGPLDSGNRKYEIELFTYPPGELMHNIEMESHISTHVEAPSHFVPALHKREAKDISEVELTRYFGSAVLVDCKDLPPKAPVDVQVLQRFDIRENDIVLVGNCSNKGDERSYMAKEGVEYLLAKKIKMVGVDDTVFPENPLYRRKNLEKYFTHDIMLSNDIPIIEGLANLGELKTQRFLFFGIPAKMGGLESFPIRAVAIEANE